MRNLFDSYNSYTFSIFYTLPRISDIRDCQQQCSRAQLDTVVDGTAHRAKTQTSLNFPDLPHLHHSCLTIYESCMSLLYICRRETYSTHSTANTFFQFIDRQSFTVFSDLILVFKHFQRD